MIDIKVNGDTGYAKAKITGSLKTTLPELTIGVFAVLDGMSDGNKTLRKMLLDSLINKLEENNNFEFKEGVSSYEHEN